VLSRPAGTPAAPAAPVRAALTRPGALAALSLASFAATLGGSAVAIALPALGRDLGLRPTDLPWVITAYSLVYGSLLLLFGRLGDLLGRRRVFVAGLATFAGASIVCAVAADALVLLGARVVQGAAAAAFTASALAIVAALYADQTVRNRAIGIYTAAGATGFAAGAVLGGLLTDLVSWRAVLVAPAVLAAIVLVAAVAQLDGDGRPPDPRPLDVPGAVTMTLTIGLLLYGLSASGSAGWSAPSTLASLGGGVAAAVGFVMIERRSRAPLIPFDVVLQPGIGLVVACLFLYSASAATTYLVAIYLQQVDGRSAWEAGWLYLPLPMAGALLAPVAGWLLDRLGGLRRATLIGVGVTIAGWIVMTGLMAVRGPIALLVAGGVAVVVGRVVAIVAMTVRLTASAGEEGRGLGAGLVTTAMELGLATALAGFSAAVGAGLSTGERGGDAVATSLLWGSLVVLGLVVAALAVAVMGQRPVSRRGRGR
jgi:MFS family permease